MSYPPPPPPPPPPGFPPQGPGGPAGGPPGYGGSGYGGPAGYGGYGAPPPPPKAPGMATASLILGILGVTIGLCLWFLPVMPVLAVIFGHISLSKIRMTGLPGRGLAITGLVTGYVGIGISLIIFVVSLLGSFTTPGPTF